MRRALIAATILAVLLLPTAVAHAQELVKFPLVPCGVRGAGGDAQPCTPCHLFEGLSRIINFVLFGITGPIAAFMIVLAGGMMLLGGATPATYSRGKGLLTNTLMGVTVILLSWAATNFLIKSIATGTDGDQWFEFTCPQFLADIQTVDAELTPGPPAGIPVTPPPRQPREPSVGGLTGSALYAALATANRTAPPPAHNSAALNSLIDCLYQDPIVAALTYPKPADGGARQNGNFTYDNDNMACNFTRGRPVGSGRCSHGGRSGTSCHYGGKTGTAGAEAVDFNATFQNVTISGVVNSDGSPRNVHSNEETLFCEIYRVLVTEKKCSFKFLNWESDHTHVSSSGCDADGTVRGAVSSQLPVGACKSFLKTPTPSPR